MRLALLLAASFLFACSSARGRGGGRVGSRGGRRGEGWGRSLYRSVDNIRRLASISNETIAVCVNETATVKIRARSYELMQEGGEVVHDKVIGGSSPDCWTERCNAFKLVQLNFSGPGTVNLTYTERGGSTRTKLSFRVNRCPEWPAYRDVCAGDYMDVEKIASTGHFSERTHSCTFSRSATASAADGHGPQFDTFPSSYRLRLDHPGSFNFSCIDINSTVRIRAFQCIKNDRALPVSNGGNFNLKCDVKIPGSEATVTWTHRFVENKTLTGKNEILVSGGMQHGFPFDIYGCEQRFTPVNIKLTSTFYIGKPIPPTILHAKCHTVPTAPIEKCSYVKMKVRIPKYSAGKVLFSFSYPDGGVSTASVPIFAERKVLDATIWKSGEGDALGHPAVVAAQMQNVDGTKSDIVGGVWME